MAKRKHISWKTKCAAALAALEYLRRPGLNYDQIKALGRKNFLALWHFDHNILHESGHEDRDEFWNLTPMHVEDHRQKTKHDARIIAKGRRIRKKHKGIALLWTDHPIERVPSPPRRKIQSRGFDKTLRRTMRGKVVPR